MFRAFRVQPLDSRRCCYLIQDSSLSLVSLAPPSYFSSISCFSFFIPQLLLVVFARSFGERPDKFLVKSSDRRTTIYRLVEWDFRETFVKRCTLKGPWMNFGGFYRERERERSDTLLWIFVSSCITPMGKQIARNVRFDTFVRSILFALPYFYDCSEKIKSNIIKKKKELGLVKTTNFLKRVQTESNSSFTRLIKKRARSRKMKF